MISAQGRNPSALAAGCIYLATMELGVHITQKQLARAAFVTDNTIRRTNSYLVRTLQSYGGHSGGVGCENFNEKSTSKSITLPSSLNSVV
jgi:transcription initiation factor TFIIIB Brf1 subunit/transcription initiation factor TFIIB